MVNFMMFILTFIFSLPAQALVVPSGVPVQVSGGSVNASVPTSYVADTSKKRVLYSGVASSTANNFLNLTRMGSQGTSLEGYQVAATGSLECDGYWAANGAQVSLNFGYGSAALGSNNTATPPTGVKLYTNDTAVGLIAESSATFKWYPFPVSFPASSYPFIKTLSGTTAQYYIVNCIQN